MPKLYFNLKDCIAKRWTKSAEECYKRHCICTGCDIIPEDMKKSCRMKDVVLLLYHKNPPQIIK